MNTAPTSEITEERPRRPLVITIFCAIAIIICAAAIPKFFTTANRARPEWLQLVALLALVATVVCVIGVWKMRKWAVLAYTGLCIAGLLFTAMMGVWSLTGSLVRTAIVVILLSQMSKMK